MDPRVRDLYKRFLFVGRDYPLGLPYVRDKAKAAFYKNRELHDPVEIKKAIKKGRWMVRELVGVIQLKKYRTLNSRYTSEELQDALRSLEFERMLLHEQQHEIGAASDPLRNDMQTGDQDESNVTTGTDGAVSDDKKAT